jgi:hypothetical protein
MDTAEIIVTVAGALLIAAILWFFLGPRRTDPTRDTHHSHDHH